MDEQKDENYIPAGINAGGLISFVQLNPKTTYNLNKTVGIIHVFSCINICCGSRKLFEPEATRTKDNHTVPTNNFKLMMNVIDSEA